MLSSFETIYIYIYSSFLFYFSPFPLSPSLFPLRRVNSRRIKLEEGGGFRGEFMGLGYRSRFQPLLNRDWYLWYTHDGTYHSPLRPAIRPLFIQYSTPYACARFFRVFWGAQLTTTTITGFSTYERARYYTCARDRQTQSHKRKQGLLGPCPLLGKWEKRGKRAGTYNRD